MGVGGLGRACIDKPLSGGSLTRAWGQRAGHSSSVAAAAASSCIQCPIGAQAVAISCIQCSIGAQAAASPCIQCTGSAAAGFMSLNLLRPALRYLGSHLSALRDLCITTFSAQEPQTPLHKRWPVLCNVAHFMTDCKVMKH